MMPEGPSLEDRPLAHGEAAPAPASVLLVDDDEKLRSLTGAFLEGHGLTVLTAGNAAQAEEVLTVTPIDVLVLDLMMPGEDGLSFCRRLAARGDRPGVIMLSAAGDDLDRIIGLEVGADDYLGKPCNPRELLARVRALLRRTERRPDLKRLAPVAAEQTYHFNGWVASAVTGRLRAPDGTMIPLTGQEFALLQIFLENPGVVLSRERLLELLRGRHTHAFERIIDAQISRLRKKLSTYGEEAADLVRTVRHEGYMFAGAVTAR